ncbi:MAG: T9SS type A sorting domain-containing protein [Bacteroidetes bacterium]|nr:T9SS type A sorting domain-containing protein [Bacteroidota bacterium]MBK8416628.1 T9SS type A sorting domain-containing protein [Bacteroidota bacterium]
MKYLVQLIMLFYLPGYGQSIFQKNYNNLVSQFSHGNSFIAKDSTYLLLSTDYFFQANNNIAITEIDSVGNINTTKSFYSDSLTTLSGSKIITINDSSCLVLAHVSKQIGMTYNYFSSALIMYSNDSIIWSTFIFDSTYFREFNLSQIKFIDGAIICGGYTNLNSNFTSNTDTTITGLLIKLDMNGSVIWANNYGNQVNVISDFENYLDGGFIAIGNDEILTSSGTDIKLMIFTTDSSGVPIWKKQIDVLGGSLNTINKVESSYVIGGNIINSIDSDGLLFKLDTLGNLIWSKKFGNTSTGDDDIMLSIANTNTIIFSSGFHRLVKVDEMGANAQSYFLSTYSTGHLLQLQLFRESEIAVIGYTQPTGKIHFLKTDTTIFSCTQTVSNYISNNYSVTLINDTLAHSAQSFNLSNLVINISNTLLSDSIFCVSATSVPEIHNNNKIQIFPNPVHSTFKFITEPEFFPIDYSIYDLTGRLLISSRINYDFEPTIDFSDLREGIYIIKLKQSNVSLKMLKQ